MKKFLAVTATTLMFTTAAGALDLSAQLHNMEMAVKENALVTGASLPSGSPAQVRIAEELDSLIPQIRESFARPYVSANKAALRDPIQGLVDQLYDSFNS